MDMKHLHYFCVIVEEGQITKAARTLNMAQPPLSQQLKNMEDELGVKLIYREGKKWEVTEAGYTLYTRAKRLLAEMEDTCREIGEFENKVTGTLAIGTSSACMSLITEQLSRFHQDFPEVYVKIGHGDTHHLEELLHQNKVDLALLLLPVDDKSYHTIELEGVSFVAVLPCEWADRHPSGKLHYRKAPAMTSCWDAEQKDTDYTKPSSANFRNTILFRASYWTVLKYRPFSHSFPQAWELLSFQTLAWDKNTGTDFAHSPLRSHSPSHGLPSYGARIVIYPMQLANLLNCYKLETRKRLLPSRCSTALLLKQSDA